MLKPSEPLPLKEHEKVMVNVARHRAGMIVWTGPLQDLDYLIEDVDNDPLESP